MRNTFFDFIIFFAKALKYIHESAPPYFKYFITNVQDGSCLWTLV
nr:hypothetical protein BAR15_180156 [Bartonella sp. AR 15-3]